MAIMLVMGNVFPNVQWIVNNVTGPMIAQFVMLDILWMLPVYANNANQIVYLVKAQLVVIYTIWEDNALNAKLIIS